VTTLQEKTQYQNTLGVDTQFSSALYTLGPINTTGSITSSSGCIITGANNKSVMRANGTYFINTRCVSPFGAPLEQTSTTVFGGLAYSVRAFYMSETMTLSNIVLFRGNTNPTTMSVAIYDTSNTRIAFATITSTIQTTFNFPVTPVVLTGGNFYYFAIVGAVNNSMYASSMVGVSIINSELHPNIQFARCFFTGTTLPLTLPLTGSSVGSIVQPPFTLIGY
jgi:hypothetical protein